MLVNESAPSGAVNKNVSRLNDLSNWVDSAIGNTLDSDFNDSPRGSKLLVSNQTINNL